VKDKGGVVSLKELQDVRMKNSRLGIGIRREKILQILKIRGFALVNDIAFELQVSRPTIKKDLEVMEKAGYVERWHNGAVFLRDEEGNTLASILMQHKNAIAMKAAQYVEQKDIIFINASSTALLMLPHIKARFVTVVTNNTKAIHLTRRDDMTVILTGGELYPSGNMLVGDLALNGARHTVASKCFLGCSGITAKKGVSTSILREAAVNEMMLTRTFGERFVLADRTKVGRNASFTCGTCDRITCLITDATAFREEVAKLRQRIKVIQTKMPLQKSVEEASGQEA
jgi:DeoR/GlpR family transcriptional regulator of sugar metabolism